MPVKKLIAGKHNCVGHMTTEAPAGNMDTEQVLERPVMMVYCGDFDSMDGPVSVTEEHLERLISSHNSRLAKLSKLSADENQIVKSMPPLQLDHSTSASMTVGRVTGELYKGLHTLEDGKTVPAMYAKKVRILGKENVEKVRDGRWSNVSIGADLEAGTLNELSITPFPAAPNASLLSRMSGKQAAFVEICQKVCGPTCDPSASELTCECFVESEEDASKLVSALKRDGRFDKIKIVSDVGGDRVCAEYKGGAKFSKGADMKEHLKKHLMEHYKMSEEQAEEHFKKMRSHLMALAHMNEEEADKHMGAMDDERMSKFADDVKDKEKMAKEGDDDGDADDKAKMTAKKAEVIKLSKGFSKDIKDARLVARKASLSGKIAKLRSSAKITPAEIKKMEFDKLAAMNDESLSQILKTYEDREPVIDAKVYGTTKATNLAALAKKASALRLSAETKKDLGHELTSEEKQALSEETMPHQPNVMDSEFGKMSHDERMKKLGEMLGDHPSKDAVMAHVHAMMAFSPAEGAEHEEKQMSALAENVNKLQNQYQALVKMFGDVAGIDSAELTE